jgi:hypothetical protein
MSPSSDNRLASLKSNTNPLQMTVHPMRKRSLKMSIKNELLHFQPLWCNFQASLLAGLDSETMQLIQKCAMF